ncbi:MAG: hypothetical protein F6J92_29100 [Symploca sp. SIO1A3]|nr:hypothetical protein [Symploca sp. SIO2C1]NER50656.1 hypothetical protein [Symploca sp. SIO1A3]
MKKLDKFANPVALLVSLSVTMGVIPVAIAASTTLEADNLTQSGVVNSLPSGSSWEIAADPKDPKCRRVINSRKVQEGVSGIPVYGVGNAENLTTNSQPTGFFPLGEQVTLSEPYEEKRLPSENNMDTIYVAITLEDNNKAWIPVTKAPRGAALPTSNSTLGACIGSAPIRGLW